MNRFGLAVWWFLSTVAWASMPPSIPHLEMEMTSEQYRALLGDRQNYADSNLSPVIDAGKRMLDWVNFLNEGRPPETIISLTSEATQIAYPINTPGLNSEKIVLHKFQALKTSLPAWMQKALFENGALLKELPVSDAEFIQLGAVVNRIYQSASRWQLQEPHLFQYETQKARDIRGFYYLGHDQKLDLKWEKWNELAADQQKQILVWLREMCENGTASNCSKKIDTVSTDGKKLSALYQSFKKSSQATWDSYFKLEDARSDVSWSEANLMRIPFTTPDRPAIEAFLKKEIQDEWRWQDWQLQLDFGPGGSNTTHIEFVPGSTPHVNSLGGSTITMDANSPLNDYNVRWTIRHEFGHVLGFPDCYVEFYDRDLGAMVNYQIDTSNLMCSRRGKFKQTHFDELKAAYFKE